MPDRPTLGRRLLDRLRGRRSPAPSAGEAITADLLSAIAAVEALAGASLHAGVAEAVGVALSGRRAAVATSLRGRSVADVLRPALERATPLVVWLEVDALPGPGALPHGVIVFAPGDPQEAVDLGLAARRAAEASLLPAVLLVTGWGASELLLPDREAADRLLGAAGDEIEAPNATQRALFGARRRRVPAWFDAQRPVVSGGPARGALARSRAVARDAVLLVPSGGFAEEACAAVEAITGRRLPAVAVAEGPRRRAMVVAAGPLGGAVLGQPEFCAVRLLRLAPFPKEELSAALFGCDGAAVLQDGADEGPGSLVAAVRALGAGEVRLGWRPGGGSGDGAAVDPDLEAAIAAFLHGDAARARLEAGATGQSGWPRRDAAVQALLDAAPGMAEVASMAASAAPPRTAGAPPAGPLPALLRRIAAERPAPDSLPRHWGELIQPLRAGLPPAPTALMAASAVPAGATALQPATRRDATLPELDPALCTGCGACWAACPDSAFAATALTVPALLDAAAASAGGSGRVHGAVKRGHKAIAARLRAGLDSSPVPDRAALRGAWDGFAEKAGFGAGREEHDAAWTATEDVLVGQRPFATEILFHRAEAAASGSGALLLLGVDPDACTGCGLCVASCGPGALSRVGRTPASVAVARALHGVHEGLPDTSGDTIAWFESQPEGDPIRALLLSRSCAEAQVGGGTTEQGSGARLAARLVAAVAEERGARGQFGLLAALTGRQAGLQERLGAVLAEPGARAGAAELLRAAREGGAEDLAGVGSALKSAGVRATVDVGEVALLAEAQLALEDRIEALKRGADGLGTARFAALVAAPSLEPLLRYPGHPWFAPAVVADPADVVPFARALCRGLVDEHLQTIRALRRAELLVGRPSDATARLHALDDLRWADLGEGDRASCPALLVFVGPEAGEPLDASGLTPLLQEDLPVRIILLDPQEVPGAGPDPALLAVASGAAWVGASTPAVPEHLGPTLRAALAAPGPAVLLLHAPSPERMGFEPDRLLEVERRAVAARALPLLRYDPTRATLHERFDVSGNPAEVPDRAFDAFVDAQPELAAHLQGDARARASRAVASRWAALQALAGPPPAPPVAAPPPAPAPSGPSRSEVEVELRARLAGNLRRLARGGEA